MMTRALFLLPTVLCLSSGSLCWAQESPQAEVTSDEFDWGDLWVDEGQEGGWYAPFTPLIVEDVRSIRLDVSGGTSLSLKRDAVAPSALNETATARQQNEYYALATLQIPFDSLLAFRSVGAKEPLLAPDEDEGTASDVDRKHDAFSAPTSARDKKSIEGEHLPEVSSAGTERAPSPEADEDDEIISSALEREVLVRVVREIADRVGASFEAADRRLKSLSRRSRWSGLSPELRLRGVLGFDRATSTEESVGAYPGDTTVRGGRDSLAEARLTFRLDRLVLGDGESALERQRLQLESDRFERVEEALEVFAAWRLATARSSDPSLSPDEILESTVEAEAALARLHLLTSGWFEGEETLRTLAR